MLAIGYEDISRLGKVVISIDDVRQEKPTLKWSDEARIYRIPL